MGTTPIPVVLLACGSFNPPTNMHLRIFELARDYLQRSGQYHVLTGILSPVHDLYNKKDLAKSQHRVEMCKLAISSSDWLQISEWESQKATKWNRTLQVLQYHRDNLQDFVKNPSLLLLNRIHIKLLCGADVLESFAIPNLWSDSDIQTILSDFGLIVVNRDKSDPTQFIYQSDVLAKFMANICIVNECIRNDISSTKIREALKCGNSIKYLVPEPVLDYIKLHNLYTM